MRILKTLNFHVTDPSTLVYIETILEILGKLAKQIKFLEILGKLAKQIKFPYHIAHFLARSYEVLPSHGIPETRIALGGHICWRNGTK
jgi:hypothetical protein